MRKGERGAPGARNHLSYQVYVSGAANFCATSVLVSGSMDCVLIDAQFTKSEANRVAEMVGRSGKKLTTIIVTHGHPDHYFGLSEILPRFPEARVVAARPVLDEIRETEKGKVEQWKPLFKDDLTDSPIEPEELVGNVVDLEGNELRVSGAVQGDTDRCTYVHIPSIGAIAAGDIVFNGSHLWLADTDDVKRKAWLRTLDTLERLGAGAIIAGHKTPKADDDAKRVLSGMRTYIAEFVEAVEKSENAQQVIDRMSKRYPNLENPIILKFAAEAAFAPQKG